jgi:hypothetical protein
MCLEFFFPYQKKFPLDKNLLGSANCHKLRGKAIWIRRLPEHPCENALGTPVASPHVIGLDEVVQNLVDVSIRCVSCETHAPVHVSSDSAPLDV